VNEEFAALEKAAIHAHSRSLEIVYLTGELTELTVAAQFGGWTDTDIVKMRQLAQDMRLRHNDINNALTEIDTLLEGI
jgi:hypothetical protein